MSKKKNRKRNTPPPKASPPTPSKAPNQAGDPAKAIKDLADLAMENASEKDLENVVKPAPAPTADKIDLEASRKQAEEAKSLFDAIRQRLEKRESEFEKLETVLNKRQKDITAERELNSEQGKELEQTQKELQRREKGIVERDADLTERELEAEAGFRSRHEKTLRKMDEEAAELGEKLLRHHQDHADNLKAYEEKVRGIREQYLAELGDERSILEHERSKLKQLQQENEWESDELKKEKVAWGNRLNRQIEEAVTAVEQRLQAALAREKELADLVAKYEGLERSSGGRSKTELAGDIDELQRDRERLREELTRRPSEEQLQRLSELESNHESLQSDLARLRQENQQLSSREGKLQLGVSELETLRDLKHAWEKREQALRTCISELKRDLGELIEKTHAQKTFPSLSAMDANDELQTGLEGGQTQSKIIPLTNMVEFVQQRIAQEGLFYTAADLRCFIAGLATSRLHLLQGISGTGKTSLPLAFAKAIGANSRLIEVQSGWRDRNDLLGYYNAFERKFYESEFLQALYLAQTPRHRDLPFIIVLDEMNLSHPEHYFADFLSALERDEEKRIVNLMTNSVEGGPDLLSDGRRICIPSNVWFVGTANHDETTKDFADKTYDRAHVMEFPRHPEKFKPKRLQATLPLGLDALLNAFDEEREKHGKESEMARTFLDKHIVDPLNKLGIGWGNRLERQLESFVPVIIGAGGSVSEAMDHLVASKLLRKLRGRFDIAPSDLSDLENQLLEAWKKLDTPEPVKCIELLKREALRLGGQH